MQLVITKLEALCMFVLLQYKDLYDLLMAIVVSLWFASFFNASSL